MILERMISGKASSSPGSAENGMNNNRVGLYVSDGDSRVDFTMTRQYLETSA